MSWSCPRPVRCLPRRRNAGILASSRKHRRLKSHPRVRRLRAFSVDCQAVTNTQPRRFSLKTGNRVPFDILVNAYSGSRSSAPRTVSYPPISKKSPETHIACRDPCCRMSTVLSVHCHPSCKSPRWTASTRYRCSFSERSLIHEIVTVKSPTRQDQQPPLGQAPRRSFACKAEPDFELQLPQRIGIARLADPQDRRLAVICNSDEFDCC